MRTIIPTASDVCAARESLSGAGEARRRARVVDLTGGAYPSVGGATESPQGGALGVSGGIPLPEPPLLRWRSARRPFLGGPL